MEDFAEKLWTEAILLGIMDRGHFAWKYGSKPFCRTLWTKVILQGMNDLDFMSAVVFSRAIERPATPVKVNADH